MDPITFVDQLASLAPSAAELARIGLNERQANDFRESFICRERKAEGGETDAMLALLKGWDLSKVQIGMIRFLQSPKQLPGKFQIGFVEADPLLLVHNTDPGQVVVQELHAPGHDLWAVATNGSTFLDALIPAAAFFTRRILGEIDFEDTDAAMAIAERCAALAGGKQFLKFFSMLLGGE